MEQYIVYSDGACAPTNPGPASWGAVVIGGTPTVRMFYGFIGPGTNQVAEITAAIEGIRLTPVGSDVELVSDSQYTLKGIKEWRRGWESRGWKNMAGKPVANKALWVTLFALVDERCVATRWVKGHSGDLYNERADKLAEMGLKVPVPGTVEEYYKPISSQSKSTTSFVVGNAVRIKSTMEAGIVIALWRDDLGDECAYVACYGEEFPTGIPDTPPQVLQYTTTDLVIA